MKAPENLSEVSSPTSTTRITNTSSNASLKKNNSINETIVP